MSFCLTLEVEAECILKENHGDFVSVLYSHKIRYIAGIFAPLSFPQAMVQIQSPAARAILGRASNIS
jgi:hypothetical protein